MNINSGTRIGVGWLLIIIGLVIIGQTIFDSYQYFTAKAEFPQIFKQGAKQLQPAAAVVGNSSSVATVEEAQAMAQKQMQQSINEAIGNMLPSESINQTFNIVVWLAFAWFLVYAGAKISAIGISLMSPKKTE